ncbi:hypothetical protein THIX_60675 [Thiomonas sp. X19]|nr:hypothetical protein THIX_60675 [Thiomonas sp. X19]
MPTLQMSIPVLHDRLVCMARDLECRFDFSKHQSPIAHDCLAPARAIFRRAANRGARD